MNTGLLLAILIVTLFTLGMRRVEYTGLNRRVKRINRRIKKVSQELRDAVAAIGTKVDAVGAAVASERDQINAALAALQQPDPDVAAAVTALTGTGERLDGIVTDINNIIPDVPVEPAPEPPPVEG